MEAIIVQGGAPEDACLVQDAPMTGSGEAGAVPDAAPAQSTAQAHSASLEQASLSFEEIRHRLTRVVESMIDKDEDKIFSEPVSRELYPTYCLFPESHLEFWPNVGWLLAPKLALYTFAKHVGIKGNVGHLSEAFKNKDNRNQAYG